MVIIIASYVCAGLAFARNEKNDVQAEATTQSEQGAQARELVDNENMTVQTDASGDKIPVPRGYVGSQAAGENEIDTGYVIYEGEEPVTDANVADAQKTRNQYVWVPVPDVSKMYGTDSSGKKWGKLYGFATTSTGSKL